MTGIRVRRRSVKDIKYSGVLTLILLIIDGREVVQREASGWRKGHEGVRKRDQ